jgi:hypothetical protein
MILRTMRFACLPLLAAALGGCGAIPTVQPVQPWEKGMLAKRDMALDQGTLEARFDEHFHASKEAASGGAGVGGGGCGCN